MSYSRFTTSGISACALEYRCSKCQNKKHSSPQEHTLISGKIVYLLYCIEHSFTVQEDAKWILKLLHHHKLHNTVDAKSRRPWVWGRSSSTGVPSLIFWSSSSKVGSMSSQPSGGGFRLLFTLGIFLCFVLKRTKAHGVFVVICEPGFRRYNLT